MQIEENLRRQSMRPAGRLWGGNPIGETLVKSPPFILKPRIGKVGKGNEIDKDIDIIEEAQLPQRNSLAQSTAEFSGLFIKIDVTTLQPPNTRQKRACSLVI
uniref:SFRICE_030890 n=1 Tax=Spodoptera frugiperda TaxID=7108 RepID=A0A2H1VLM1_SPOFR